MKKTGSLIVTMFVSMAMVASFASAAQKASGGKKGFSRPYGMAGCGLGSMAFGKKGGQVFAATTNGTAYNQMFGITLGTSNCVDDPNAEVASNVDKFVVANKGSLASDIARGDGETLAGLSQLMNCQVGSDQLGAALQKNFSEIFPSVKVEANEVTDSIITVIMNEQSLAGKCNVVS